VLAAARKAAVVAVAVAWGVASHGQAVHALLTALG
jgi:hypothetical protein